MKMLVTIALQFLFIQVVFAETAFDIFKSQVHPVLKNRCNECHSFLQTPHHATDDVDVAYAEARPTINLIAPERSKLWVQSFNDHCEDARYCTTKDQNFFEAIANWIVKERAENVEPFDLMATLEIPLNQIQKDGDLLWLEAQLTNQVQFRIKVQRFTQDYIMFTSPQMISRDRYVSYEGFKLQSKDVQAQSQNFKNKSVVVKPTEEPVALSLFDQGYVMALIPELEMKVAKIELRMNKFSEDLSRNEAKVLWEKGYFLPIKQTALSPKVIQVAVSRSHSCALFENKKLKCWGGGTYGQLGQGSGKSYGGTEGSIGKGLPFIDLGDFAVEEVYLGEYVTCGINSERKLKCWGNGDDGKLANGQEGSIGTNKTQLGNNLNFSDLGDEKIKMIGGFNTHFCAVLESGKVKCWGKGNFGALGNGSTNSLGGSPSTIGGGLPYVDLGNVPKAIMVKTGEQFSCALFENGKVKCWGLNNYGQLGLGSKASKGADPSTMGEALPYVDVGERVEKIEVGHYFVCALTVSKKVKCWGGNNFGNLGLGDRTNRGDLPGQMGQNLPYVDIGKDRAKDLFVGAIHTCVLTEKDQLKCWGNNKEGILAIGTNENIGDNSGEMGEELKPAKLGAAKLEKVGSGGWHSCFLLETGEVKCIGYGSSGRLGNGDILNIGGSPTEVGSAIKPVPLDQVLGFD